jgi:chaperonin GroEL
MKDNLYTSSEAREKLMSGITRASNAIAITMGSAGANSVIEDIRSPGYMISNDGASILERIHFADPIEELGRKILSEAVGRANKNSGDGSSSATLLTASILSEGVKHIGETSPMEIKRSLEACLPLIEESLKAQRKDLVDKDGNIDFTLLAQVASISAEDEKIGEMIAEIYKSIGPSGIINWEPSKDTKDSFSIGTGIKIDGATYASRYMCDQLPSGEYTYQATIENPLVLLAYSKITSQGEMEKLVGELQDQGVKDLVIFCNEMDTPILNSFILARAPQTLGIRFLVIKMPTVFNDLWWEDLEKASGGRIISPASGIKMKDAKMEFLGRFGKITVNREDTFIDGINDLTTHLLALKVDGSDEALARAARLNTKTARYFVGGHSESSLAHRRLKIEDAINSAYSALHSGILPGGGLALLNAAFKFDGQKITDVGMLILREALRKPLIQIVNNAGANEKEIGVGLGRQNIGKNTIGFNSKTGEIVDMFEAGIIDAYDVVLGSIKAAIGVAAGVLTAGSVVLLPRNENSVDEAIKQIMQTPQ